MDRWEKLLRKFKAGKNKKEIEIHKKKREEELKQTSKTIIKSNIIEDLKRMGIEQGDVLWVHSSLRRIGYVEGGSLTVIGALMKTIGVEGTLLIPTFTRRTMYKNCIQKGFKFDPKTTETGLGAIPSTFFKMEGVTRSIHPTSSVSAIGKYAKEMTESHHIGNRAFGPNSPFGKMIEYDGKIIGIGLTLKHAPTQYHYIEDIPEVWEFPFRVKTVESYKIKCKKEKSKNIEVEVFPLDPVISKTRIDKSPNSFIQNYLWEIYEKMGVFTLDFIGEAKTWLVNAKSFCNMLLNCARIGVTIYSTEEYLKKNNLYPFNFIKDKLKRLDNIIK